MGQAGGFVLGLQVGGGGELRVRRAKRATLSTGGSLRWLPVARRADSAPASRDSCCGRRCRGGWRARKLSPNRAACVVVCAWGLCRVLRVW